MIPRSGTARDWSRVVGVRQRPQKRIVPGRGHVRPEVSIWPLTADDRSWSFFSEVRISRQMSTHSSQICTLGPAINFFTSRCDLLQNEHLRIASSGLVDGDDSLFLPNIQTVNGTALQLRGPRRGMVAQLRHGSAAGPRPLHALVGASRHQPASAATPTMRKPILRLYETMTPSCTVVHTTDHSPFERRIKTR